jgi:hypothetical protein
MTQQTQGHITQRFHAESAPGIELQRHYLVPVLRHIITSYHYVISLRHIITSYHHVISLRHIITSYHHVISSRHIITSYHHVISLRHIITSYHYVILLRLVITSYHYVSSLRHIITSRHSVPRHVFLHDVAVRVRVQVGEGPARAAPMPPMRVGGGMVGRVARVIRVLLQCACATETPAEKCRIYQI